ncbi:MAG: hypothetical protein GY822_06790 [Deltaproteobacteria bacterium]|nr:hypothetical protein [Deltaproteobacteria bacterium]
MQKNADVKPLFGGVFSSPRRIMLQLCPEVYALEESVLRDVARINKFRTIETTSRTPWSV